jgi:hypothetical protein
MNSKTPQENKRIPSNDPSSAEENITNKGEIDTENQDSDLTDDDFEALGPKDLSMDGGDDELLKHREYPVNFSGDDLDVPGAELDDEDEATGSEDEENNSYSIGGDNHEDLEEDSSAH